MTIAEAAVPYVKYRLLLLAEQAKWKAAGNEGPLKLTGVDHESKLQPADPLDAFFDYNKMALQFGFVSMFCAAFPLAPVRLGQQHFGDSHGCREAFAWNAAPRAIGARGGRWCLDADLRAHQPHRRGHEHRCTM